MYATVRRYEGIDKAPRVSKLPGFCGYYLIDGGETVLTSIGLFENAKEAHESTRIAARWVREQKLESALPNTPKVTAGQVLAHESRGAAVTNGVPALAWGSEDIVTSDEQQIRD